MDQRVEPPFLIPAKPGVAVGTRRAGRGIWPWLVAGAIVLTALVIWLQPWSSSGSVGPGAMRHAVPAVAVARAQKADMPIRLSSLGTVTSLATVTVRSQLSGYLTAVDFREGQMVKKGEVLAEVDRRPYEAALAQYQGQLERDQALLDNARLDLERYQRLIKQDSTSKQTVDTAAATVRQYEGTVRADQALVDTQKLNLTYCSIVAPVDGRAGLRQVDAGNYVTASDSTGIVVVTKISPTSVLFTLPEDDLQPVMAQLKAGARLKVTAYDRTGTNPLAEGVLDTLDNQIDTTTGTVKLRALFDNADGSLFPNQFVNVSMLVETLTKVVTVPSAAVQNGTPGAFVYVVNSNDTVTLRTVKIGPSADGRTAILSGLSEGDTVVVDGIDSLMDGAKVSIPGTPGTAAPAAPAAAG